VESLVLAVLMIAYGVVPGWTLLLVIPLVLVTYLGATGAVLLLCCLGARYRDIGNVVQHVNRLFFYFSPVMYPVDFIPEHLRDLYMLNPVTCAIELARDVIVRNQVPPLDVTLYYTIFSLGLMVLGLLVFSRLQGRVTKYL